MDRTQLVIERRGVLLAGVASLAACAGADHFGPRLNNPSELSLVSAVVFPGFTPASLSDRMRHYGVPGAQITVVRRSLPALRIATGLNNAILNAFVGSRTRFQAASLSKPVTALGALCLVASGAIGLDDDVRPLLGDWRLEFAAGVSPRSVTLRRLLSHTAGVSTPSFPGFARDAPLPSLREILDGAPIANSPRVEVAHPEGAYRYSGGGYQIVEYLIERITRQSFADYMRDTVLNPARMRDSTFTTPTLGNLASGHDWGGFPRENGWLAYPQHAAAGLWSTADDLALLLGAVIDAYRGGGIIPRALARDALTELVPGGGLGFGVSGEGDAKLVSHAGWNRGYRSYIAAYPERGEAIAVMANGDRGNEFIMEVLRGAARRFDWPDFQPQRHERAVWSESARAALPGEFRFEEADFSVTIERAGDDFTLRSPRGSAYTLTPIAPDAVVSIEDGETIRIIERGAALSMWGMIARRA